MVFCCRITIGKIVFYGFNEIEINKAWQKFTDTAVIKIPKALHYEENGRLIPVSDLKEFINTGDPVRIEMGYNRELVTDFEGYVARGVRPTIPYEIECEDEMWQLKRKEVSVSIPDATVKQIIEAAAPGYDVDCINEVYGDFSLKNVTPVQVFDELRQKAGLYTFFRGKRLVCGLIYSDPGITNIVANYAFGRNIIDSSLQYVRPEDTKLKIYGSSIQNDGSVIRVEVGEEGGNIERKNYSFEISKEELKKQLQRRLELSENSGGYTGELTSFGFPVVEHGQTIRIVDTIYEQRDSKHFVEEVNIKASMTGGYRRIIKVGKNA